MPTRSGLVSQDTQCIAAPKTGAWARAWRTSFLFGNAARQYLRKMYAPHDTQRRSVVNTSQHGLASNTVTISSKDGRLAGDADQQLCVRARVCSCAGCGCAQGFKNADVEISNAM